MSAGKTAWKFNLGAAASGLQGFGYVARPMQHADYINAVLALQIEQEVIFKVLDGQHPDAVDKGYFA